MNIKRGFFRLWVVFSVVWVIGSLAIALNDSSVPSLTNGCHQLTEFVVEKTGKPLGPADVAACEADWRKERLEIAGNLALPPLGLLAVWLVGGWVAAGFRSKKPN